MTDFKQQYKNPRPGFGDADHRRFLRACNYDKSRKEVRSRAFEKNRNLQDISPILRQEEDVSTITDERMKKLIRWKEARERKKKLESSTKKPAFKVGVVHHSLCSPLMKSKSITTAKTPKKTQQSNQIQKRITRATEKRLLAKAAAAKQAVKNLPLVSTKHHQSIKTSSPNMKKSFAPVDYRFKPPSGLQEISLFGLVPIEETPQEKYISSERNTQVSDDNMKNFKTFITSPKLSLNKRNSSDKLNKLSICNSDELNRTVTITSSLKEQEKNEIDIQNPAQEKNSSSSTDAKTPPLQKITTSSEKENRTMDDLIVFSPYLTRSRGKRNSRKEGQQRLGIGRRSDEIPTKDTIMQNLNICVEQEERTAQYFKFLVNKETDRLKQVCKKWLAIRLEKDVPEDAIYEIQQAVGQTNLLINKKFERFRRLVQDCETGKGEMLVTCRDLQGFWDMTYQDIEDCNMRFERLEERRNKEWQEEEHTAQYFKFLVNKETDRLEEFCKKWLAIRLEEGIPEDATYEIQQAVGQTNLLINKKFARFRRLVQDCETGKGEMLVTCEDLQGFWDMTYQEIEDCNMRFEKLEKRRNREWQEEELTAKPVKKRMPVKKQNPAKKQTVPSKQSKLQSFILAVRKKNKKETGTLNMEDLSQDVHINEKPSNRKSVTVLEENVNTRRNGKRSKSLNNLNKSKSTQHESKSSRTSSIQKVQFSDKSKRMKSPHVIMKISQKCKTPEIQLDDTILYVNSDQTPAKSILKKSEELESKEARIKSAHKVNFDDTVFLTEVPLDEEQQNKLSLAAALNRIDSLDLDKIYQSPLANIEKRLDFEDSSSNDDMSELGLEILPKEKRNKHKSSVQITSDIVYPLTDITSSVSIKEPSLNNGEITSSRKSLRKRVQHKEHNISNKKDDDLFLTQTHIDDEIISNEMDNLDLGRKVLRNRTILANSTPKSTSKMTTSKRTSVSKERKSSIKSRKNSLKLSQKDENKYMTPNKSNTTEEKDVTLMDNIENVDNIKRKRSLRKSVAFDETCVACAENKPVLPMTPYVRRSKTSSRQRRSKHALQDDDLISWDTPDQKQRPRRVTRSQSDF